MTQIKDLDLFEKVYLKKNGGISAFLFVLPIPPHVSKAISSA